MTGRAIFDISLSTLDEERFGIRSARAENVSSENIANVLNFCATNHVVFLIARCAATDIKAAQAMEQNGFILTDTLVYYRRMLDGNWPTKSDSKIEIRPMLDGDERQVEAVALQAFKNYRGHYASDSRLDRNKCDDVYQDWARRSCLIRDKHHEVFTAASQERIIAFLTTRMNNADQGEGVLFAVSPEAQGMGISSMLMIAGMNWCSNLKAQEMIISTQIVNTAVQKVWGRLGFQPLSYIYTFHKWFDD